MGKLNKLSLEELLDIFSESAIKYDAGLKEGNGSAVSNSAKKKYAIRLELESRGEIGSLWKLTGRDKSESSQVHALSVLAAIGDDKALAQLKVLSRTLSGMPGHLAGENHDMILWQRKNKA